RLVSETFAGEYLSVFKGRGMEFAEVREYTPGDDVRTIDWNVMARTGRPYVRQYTEERELTVVIACDLSGSLFFCAPGRFKHEIPVAISDPREEELAAVNACLELEDPESGEKILTYAGREQAQRHRRQELERREKLDRMFALYGLDAIEVRTDKPYIDPIIQFF